MGAHARFWVLAFLLSIISQPALAQTAPPSSSPAPSQPAQETPAWHNPENTNFSIFDPCGGPKELLNKFGPTPCVYVKGQAMVSAGYMNLNTHGSLTVSGNGPLGLTESVPISGNADVYPQLLIAFGVSANSQLQLTMPSQVEIHTQRFGSFGETSDPSITYKQRVFFSPTKYTQVAVDLGYTPPLNNDAINSPGPSYLAELDLAQPLNVNLTFGLWWTFQNSTTTSFSQPPQRGWSAPVGVYFAWSPAASSFELLPVVYHSFNPNRTALAIQAVQLLSRDLSIALTYGGAETSSQSNGPFAQVLRFATNTSPRVFSVNLYYLIHESNLPPEEQQAQPTPTPTPLHN